jgi:serine phosphatase RsbU (regulator of sigma subunit)
MKKNFQAKLTISIIFVFQIGFWSFIFLSYSHLNNHVVQQVKEDNLVIGKQLVTLLKQTGLTDENPDTDSIIQKLCDEVKLPNGGFICAINALGNLVAAPGLKPGMTMKFNPILTDFDRKEKIFPVDLEKGVHFTGYANFIEDNRLDVIASLPLGNSLRIFVHQNSAVIRQKARASVGPLIYLGLLVTLVAGVFTFFATRKIVLSYESKIETQNGELKFALTEIKEKQTEILAQNEALAQSNRIIFDQNKEITDSISYAQRIQCAMLPKKEIAKSMIKDDFIMFLPRNMVSGDFYWYHNTGDFLVVAAVDCTGHGVPGALMSMIGISFLNEIVLEEGNRDASSILNNLRKKVVNSLGQGLGGDSASDGMDMSLCVINNTNYQMQFAGAYNPVYIIRNNELIEFKADKIPIGVHPKMEINFSAHQIQLISGDLVYLFSDGYADQFGGPNGRKFMTKNFKQLLLNIANMDLNQQKSVLEETILNWKGRQEQVDDILVIGLKVK